MVNLNISKGVFIPKFYPFLLDYSHRWEFYMGSAGSGKSYFITQKVIVRCLKEKIRILVCRRYASTIRNTCFSLFKDVLAKWQLLPFVKINESDFRIRFQNGSEIIFTGLDEETKLLSLNDIGTIFVEEAFEVPQNIVEQLNLRMRGKNPDQQIIMAWNPISQASWIYEFTVKNPPENSVFIHSTYKDNPFLSKAYIAELEGLMERNPQKGRVYCLGEWGVNAEGLVITNWKTEAFDPMALSAAGLEHRCGLDFGFIDPTAAINTLYDRENHKIYIFEEFYKKGCQLSEVAAAIKKMEIGKTKIFVDSAEPRSLQFLRNEGINAAACIKGSNSVKEGIMFLQDNEIIVLPECQNIINELSNFSYIKSKATGEFTEQTTHEFSHAIDACRYAYSDIYRNKKVKVVSKNLLNL